MSISVRDFHKSYGNFEAVKGINFDVADGSFFALLGVNGAGKSTTINCLTTLLRPTSGNIEIAGFRLGHDNAEIRNHIGVVFQSPLLDLRLTVRENLGLRGRLHHMRPYHQRRRIAELSELLDLSPFLDQRYGKLSGGQKRRADIARALLHEPEVLFLDEPTSGLDPQNREQVWHAILDVRKHTGMTVLLTTHYMEETERADLVCIIDQGDVIAEGTPSQLREAHSSAELALRSNRPYLLRRWLTAMQADISFFPRTADDPLRLHVHSPDDAKQLLDVLWEDIEDFEFRHGSMNDVFLNLTTQRSQDAHEADGTHHDRSDR